MGQPEQAIHPSQIKHMSSQSPGVGHLKQSVRLAGAIGYSSEMEEAS